jgi:hypothetical protein
MLTRFFRSAPRSTALAAALFVIATLLTLVGTAHADRRWHRRPPPVQNQTPTNAAAGQGPVRHDTPFAPVPESALQIRAVQYDGRTNGALRVEVKNPTAAALKFSAKGLFFVPEGDPNTAPQRLGAVGPLKLADAPRNVEPSELPEIAVPPGATIDLALDVFCIDSHRPSPSPQNRFRIGKTKLPQSLANEIERNATTAVKAQAQAGAPAPRPAAKHAIQNEVWRSRDAKWVELDGEGRQEATKKSR